MNPLQWLVPWEPSLAVAIATVVMALLFIKGGGRCRLRFRQKLYFWTGLLTLYAVAHTQIDYYAEHAFFIHQLQSLVLHQLGPFLIALARPWAVLSAGMPQAIRRLIQRISVLRSMRWTLNALFHPAAAVLVFAGLTIFWLLPSVHFIAMLDWRVYRLMNWSMVLNGLMFWGLVLDSRSQWSPGSRITTMLAAAPPQILMGILIFFTPRELYPIYTLCGRAFTGMSPLTDQQLGGLILWMHGTMMSVIGILIVIRRELRQPRRISCDPPINKAAG